MTAPKKVKLSASQRLAGKRRGGKVRAAKRVIGRMGVK